MTTFRADARKKGTRKKKVYGVFGFCLEVRLYLHNISSVVQRQLPSVRHNENARAKSVAVLPEGKANQINHLLFNPTGNLRVPG